MSYTGKFTKANGKKARVILAVLSAITLVVAAVSCPLFATLQVAKISGTMLKVEVINKLPTNLAMPNIETIVFCSCDFQ